MRKTKTKAELEKEISALKRLVAEEVRRGDSNAQACAEWKGNYEALEHFRAKANQEYEKEIEGLKKQAEGERELNDSLFREVFAMRKVILLLTEIGEFPKPMIIPFSKES